MENSKAIVNRSFLSFSRVVLNLCIRWEVILQHILPILEKFSTTSAGADQGIFLAGGAPQRNDFSLVSCVFCFSLVVVLFLLFVLFCFFFQETSCFRKLLVILEGGLGRGCVPLP